MEILAPVGGFKQLRAALAAKADAVYLGSDRFSARQGAENFTLEEIREVVKACHFEDIKVYLAVNTLFKDDEILDALNLCVDAFKMGVDAIIIQDFGLLYLLERYYPEIEKHASTQMSIHNLDGARFAVAKGISRVVLARELTLNEIKAISNSEIETEVFIHGAICISYSGQCLFSSLNGDRSANRGRCAQPCRKPYTLLANGKKTDSGFLISPRDRSYIDDMDDLINAGVASFKIEGRLRNQYYVYESIIQYRKAMEKKPYEIEKLGQIFKRDEFSNTYLYDEPSPAFITKKGGSNKGILMGTVRKGKIRLACDLELSDGIKSSKGGFILTKIVKDGKSIKFATKGDTVELFPKKYRDGDILFKTNSFQQKKNIDKMIEDYSPKQLSVDVKVEFLIGKELRIYNEDLDISYSMVEKALKSPVASEKIIENMEKSGSEYTKLRVKELKYEEGFIRVSEINKARRDFIEKYESSFILKEKNIEKRAIEKADLNPKNREGVRMIIISRKTELSALDADLSVCLNPFMAEKNALSVKDLKEIDKKGHQYYLKVPTIVREEIEDICDFISSLKGIEGIVTANLGIINRLKGKLKIIGYYDLNIINSYGVNLFEDLDYIIPSAEMSKKDLEGMSNKDRLMPMIYGNIKYMNMEYSPLDAIEYEEDKDYELEENGRKTLIKKDVFSRVNLYSEKPLNHSYRINEYKNMGYNNFIIEPIKYDNFKEILDAFLDDKGFSKEELFHYKRGIL